MGYATSGLQGGVEAGWERTGWAGGIGPDCDQVQSPIRVCVLKCLLCVLVRDGGSRLRDIRRHDRRQRSAQALRTTDLKLCVIVWTLCYICFGQ